MAKYNKLTLIQLEKTGNRQTLPTTDVSIRTVHHTSLQKHPCNSASDNKRLHV